MVSDPEPAFSGWHSWSEVAAGRAPGLSEIGTYLLARFTDAAPTAFDPTAEEIFYVGETHGRTRSLAARLGDFGRSAGFSGPRANGHYAAWSYKDSFPQDWRDEEADSSKVYVALCPAPRDLPSPAARGVYPLLVEAMMIWRYTVRHTHLPELNSSGSGHELPTFPAFDADLLQAVAEQANADEAVERLMQDIAVALRYTRNRRTWRSNASGLVSIERVLGGKYRLRLTWREGVAGVHMRLIGSDHTWFGDNADEGLAASAAELKARLELLWKRWHSEASRPR
jgi:hypothetical protein